MHWKSSVEKHPIAWMVAGGLAAWRLASIINKERIASPIRKAVGVVELGDDPEYWAYPDNFLGELISCEWCLSVWTGGLMTALLYVFPPAVLPFALSAFSIMFKKRIEEDPEGIFVEVEGGDDGSD
jgi:hypothetical protein